LIDFLGFLWLQIKQFAVIDTQKDTMYVSKYPDVYAYQYTEIPKIVRASMNSLTENKFLMA
jgi:hypothetical protein